MATDYTSLKAEVANWLDREDLTSEIESCIQFAEARFNRSLWAAEREEATTLEATSAEVALPSDFSAIRSLHITADPLIIIEPMALPLLRASHRAGATGQPCNYAVTGGDTLVLAPTPDDTYTIVLDYYRTIPALSDSNPTNWLLTSHPDLYLSASLVEAFLIVRDQERAQLWEAKTASTITQLESAGRYKAHGGLPGRMRAPHVV